MKRMLQMIFGKWSVKSSVERLTLDDLRRQVIILNNEEKKLNSEIEATEKAKMRFFEQASGKDISDRQRMQAAQKIADLDQRLKDIDRRWHKLCKDRKIVEGIIRIKNEKLNPTTGYFLLDLDPEEVRNWVEKNDVDIEIANDKSNQIVELFNHEASFESSFPMSDAVQSVYQQLCEQREAKMRAADLADTEPQEKEEFGWSSLEKS
jgi:hypothetical protein